MRTLRLPAMLLALLVTLFATLAACGDEVDPPTATDSDDTSAPATGLDLTGQWVLTAGSAADGPLTLEPTHPVTLAVEGTAVSGTSACNQYLGEVTVDGDSVSFGALGGTQMACMPESVMDLEQAYLAALGAVDTGTRDDTSLTLTGPDTTLEFEPAPPVETAELVGTAWVLESVISGDAVASTVGMPAKLRLKDDGTMSGGTGCRVLHGSWTLEDDQLSVPDMGITKNACPGEVDAQDSLVVAVLTGPAAVAIDGQSLTLTLADGTGLGYRAK